MNKKETQIFKYLLARYKDQWDRNQYSRDNYNEDLAYYTGYRNKNNYPLVYNESFNKILPIVYSLLSRYMSQLYQGGNIVSVKPRKSQDAVNAKKVEAVLNFQLENLNDIDMQGGSYLTMMKWLFNMTTFGKGIAKAYWRKEERIGPKRMMLQVPSFNSRGDFQGYDSLDHISQETQVAYDAPYVEILHNKLFVPHPEYRNIQQMPAVFCVYKRSIDYIKKMADKGVFLGKNLKELGWTGDGGAGVYAKDSDEAFVTSLGIEGALTQEEMEDDRKTRDVDIIEAHAKLILESAPYEVGSGMKIKGVEEEVLVHIGNYKTILSIQKSPYGVRPFFDIGCYMHPEMFWDIGMVRLTKGIQEQVDNLANLRIQNAMMMVNQMLRVDPDSDVDPESLVWKPFGIVPALKDEVEPLSIPDFNSNIFMEQQSFYEDTIQDLTGMYDYNMGQTPARQERVGTVYCLKSDTYEILTSGGWKRFSDLDRTEKVMTLNYQTDEMEWQKPTEYIEFPEDNYELYHFKGASAEFYCTADHRIPIEREGRNGFKKQIVRAGELSECSHAKIPLTGAWVGTEDDINEFGLSKEGWAAFMGIWLSEGHIQHKVKNWCYRVGISQEQGRTADLIQTLIETLPLNLKYNGKQWLVNNKALWSYFHQFGYSWEKYVPFNLKNQSPRILSIFLDWFHKGDGHINHCGQRCFTTTSKRLADDIQEIILKTGKRAHIWIEEKENDKHHDAYHIHESSDKYAWWYHNRKKTVTKENHKCKVSCLRVPNGIFLIRSVDCKKPVWTGNSIQSMGEARAKLMLMSADYMGFRSLLKFMMVLNTNHLPSGFEYRVSDRDNHSFGNIFGNAIHPNFDYAVRYTSMEPALGKQARADRLVQLFGMLNQSPWLNQYQHIKMIYELLDVYESASLLKTPEQFQKEMQQQQQMAMITEQMKSRFQTEGKLQVGGQKIQGNLALGAQDIQGDILLESLKQEAQAAS